MKIVYSSGFGDIPGGTAVKNPPASARDARDMGLIAGSVRSPGAGNGNPLQCSCLENSLDKVTWQATVRGVAKSGTQLSTHSTNKLDKSCSVPNELEILCYSE